jgi:chemotaxis protein histidine kinase CheA
MASLRDKVGKMPAAQLEAMAREAGDAVAELRGPFMRASLENVERLRQLFTAVAERPPGWEAEAYRMAHDLKGQGTSFDFELVSHIAHALCRHLADRGRESGPDPAARDQRALALCEALRVVLSKDIRGMGGEHGAALLKILSLPTPLPDSGAGRPSG